MRNPIATASDRMRLEASYYKGAAYDRLNQDWAFWRLSGDQQMRYDIQTLRNRARDLVANNSTASAIPDIYAENVIGANGIVMQAEIENTRGAQNKDACARIEDSFAEWCEEGNCTADGQGAFIDAQKLIAQTEVIDGEAMIYHVEGYPNKWGYAIDLIDADQLDHNYTVTGSDKVNSIRMGVETDKWHRAVAYWMWTAHPSEPEGKTRVRYPAGPFDHVYVQKRVKATRAVTWLAPVIFDINMLGGYRDAAITTARIAACATPWIKADPDAGVNPRENTKGEKNIPLRLAPGQINRLLPGESLEQFAPDQPSAQFKEFDLAVIRSIATGQRLSYMSLSGDLSATSFASGRIGILAERAVFQFHQQRFVRRVLTRIYRRWLKMAMLSGALKLPTMRPEDYWKVVWHPRPFPWIDPQKDIDLAERSVGMGINDLTTLAAEQGRSIEDVFKRRRREIDLAEQYDIPLIIAAGRAKPIDVDTTQEAEEDKSGGDSDAGGSTNPPKQRAVPGKKKPGQNGNGSNGNGNGAHGRIPILR
jgi:lambda family phage portal protein